MNERAVPYLSLVLACMLSACGSKTWNNPYPDAEGTSNVVYSSFSERPKHLDPVSSYSSNEYQFIAQIYEPPLQYHYLMRPYTLIPLTAEHLPQVRYLDQSGEPVPRGQVQEIAYSEYIVSIRPGIRYQPHPAFAADDSGHPRYLDLEKEDLEDVYVLSDFRTPVPGN